ncbi:MAG: hypothetical protein H7070_07015 [Saprospiraceae bacterium]|nr:hypothetical protein [Pyrinomonadaceae bacterium]
MDWKLLERAKQLGVEVLGETAAVGLSRNSPSQWVLKIRNSDGTSAEIETGLIIDATGRSRIVSKLVQKNAGYLNQIPTPNRNAYIGFKSHLQNVHIEKGRCEIYSFRDGYGGLSPIEDGLANHCFLVRSSVVREFSGNTDKLVEEVIYKNKRAFETMKDSLPSAKYLAVSVDSFGLKNLSPAPGILAVGDSAAFIDPFTGGGMLMALESARILAGCVALHNLSFETLSTEYKRLHKQTFARRLLVSSLLRRFAFMPFFAKTAISILDVSGISRKFLARATR